MNGTYRLVACLGAAGMLTLTIACGSPRHAPRGPVVSSVPAPPTPTVRREGPLSFQAKVPETPWPVRQRLMKEAGKLYLDRAALRADGQRFLALVEQLFPAPPTAEIAAGIAVARREMSLVESLAPYPLDAVSNAFLSATSRLGLCARPPGQMWHCWTDLIVRSRPEDPPFELTEPAPGIVQLAIRDLSDASDPAWGGFSGALERIARARGVVLDLREAVGADPRPILPLLEQLTGRTPLRPLRTIRRPAALEPHVEAYARRFTAAPRNHDVWASLVGTMPAGDSARAPALAVLVGPGCAAACELAARVLATYASATLFGDVQRAGRLARDEPALLVLPRSKIEIYFHATEYLLSEDIERATGPTAQWWMRLEESYQGDLAAFAAQEIARRLAGTPQPRCDAYPAYATVDRLPEALRAKIPGASTLGSGCRLRISVTADAPLSAVRRFAATCTPGVSIQWAAPITLPGDLPLSQLSQLAQSDLVQRIDIKCQREFQLL